MRLNQVEGRTEKRRRTLGAVLCLCLSALFSWAVVAEEPERFDKDRDLFLPQFDCKTDVDDLHSVAAVATMLGDERLAGVQYHAVAGAYGRQGGLYVPGGSLFELAFGEQWSDAHNDREGALARVVAQVTAVLEEGGSVWVAEAGQSDFTADWLARVADELPEVDLEERVHVVQHSDWNEQSASPEKLSLVKRLASYHKIPDGNATGNGTPGFRSGSPEHWPRAVGDPESGELWRLARRLGEEFNGRQERYDNPAVAGGGIDFSDTAETCWIFGFEELFDVEAFFAAFTAAAPAPAAEVRELAGSYILPDGEWERVEATFVANGSDSWEVEFRFDFQGRSDTWTGWATGSLSAGPLEGRVEVEKMDRVFVFRGEVTEGVFAATHAEIEYGGETPTGTMTLRPVVEED